MNPNVGRVRPGEPAESNSHLLFARLGGTLRPTSTTGSRAQRAIKVRGSLSLRTLRSFAARKIPADRQDTAEFTVETTPGRRLFKNRLAKTAAIQGG